MATSAYNFSLVADDQGHALRHRLAGLCYFIRANIETLGVHLSDIKILLTGHAHFDQGRRHRDAGRRHAHRHLTPGHTQGCTTWTMEAAEHGTTYQMAFTGSVTINEGVHLVGTTRVPAIAEHYPQAFRVLHGIKADVFVAQHGGVFGLEEKAKRVSSTVNPFVDPAGHQRFVSIAEQAYRKQLAAEQPR